MTIENIEATARQLISSLAQEPGPLLPVLHKLQQHFGYIPKECVATVAELLSLSRAEVHGVVSFYDWFQTEPGGNKTVYICRAEACQAMGSTAVEVAAKAHLGIDFHQTSSDGNIRLEPVYCLGNCACSPSVMVDEKLYSHVTSKSIADILNKAAERKT